MGESIPAGARCQLLLVLAQDGGGGVEGGSRQRQRRGESVHPLLAVSWFEMMRDERLEMMRERSRERERAREMCWGMLRPLLFCLTSARAACGLYTYSARVHTCRYMCVPHVCHVVSSNRHAAFLHRPSTQHTGSCSGYGCIEKSPCTVYTCTRVLYKLCDVDCTHISIQVYLS